MKSETLFELNGREWAYVSFHHLIRGISFQDNMFSLCFLRQLVKELVVGIE